MKYICLNKHILVISIVFNQFLFFTQNDYNNTINY